MTAKLSDVARIAGVSVSTASRALSHPEMLRPATVKRVRLAARALGYAPNAAAVALTTGRYESLGLVLHSLTNPLYARFASSVQRHAQEHGYGLHIVDTVGVDDREVELCESLCRHQTGGIVSIASRLPEQQLRMLRERIPLVLVNRHVSGIPAVVVDVSTGIARMIDHLADLGHSHIVYVSGPIQTWSDERRRRRVRERIRLYDMRMELIGPTPPVFRSGIVAAERALSVGATAVLAYNSLIALGVMFQLAAAGARVPEDISVASGDDFETLGVSGPALTALRLPIDDAGALSVQLMLALLAGEKPPSKPLTIPVSLVPRQSTARAATASRVPH
ncbi:MAG: LacI family DNA-binding transcriptional regulator [Actinophytocola sp.]|nr:LacI family DNA-binding transcriptional regulator [Actinophytocola sp.]